MLPSLQHQRK